MIIPPTHDPPVVPSGHAVVPSRRRFRFGGDDSGMSTAEYAIGTVAACGFAGLLLKILTSPEVSGLLRDVIKRAFSLVF
jgi:hypothetical protein